MLLAITLIMNNPCMRNEFYRKKSRLTIFNRNLDFCCFGAEDRNRTGTIFEDRRILSPVRLPVPPLRHILMLVPGQIFYSKE